MAKILVTGGAGFIGSHTVVALHEAGHHPIIVDDFSNSDRRILEGIAEITGENFPFYQIDCNNQSSLRKVFENEKNISGVIHFAAFKAVGESVEQPLKYYQNNIGSLVSLLAVMKEFNITQLVFSSSCTVYGNPEDLPVTELSVSNIAMSPYGNTKVVCEQIIKDASNSGQRLNAVLLRYFNPIGAHPTGLIGELPLGVPNNLVPFITQTAAGWRDMLTIYGNNYDTPDGTCVRDYIHVVDLANAHMAALNWTQKQQTSVAEVFNIGTGNGNSVMDVVKTFEKISEVKLNYRIGQRRSGDVDAVYGSVDKAREVLGWNTTMSMEDALTHAWNWQKKLEEQI
ncbi:MAG: UDP-glucose 4-epimerase [Flavobacteriales bacterium]|jgi:UDP-glucose 4-epimerase